MRRILVYIAIAFVVLAVPLERADVADLHPVQTVALYKIQGGYRIETDTEDYGVGKTVAEAYHDLMETTPGVIYLDTAEFYLVSMEAAPAAHEMKRYLKKNVKVCAAVGQGDLPLISKYLSVQRGLEPLSQWELGEELPVLDCRSDRIKFLQKNAK